MEHLHLSFQTFFKQLSLGPFCSSRVYKSIFTFPTISMFKSVEDRESRQPLFMPSVHLDKATDSQH